jgi:solute carrier family 25 (mitochondrial oxoglutarate transporter), member 11
MDFLENISKWTVPFAIGGISGAVATMVIQPLDTLKVQVQIVSEQLGKIKSNSLTISNIVMKIKTEQGLQVLYRGLDSAIFRQLFYASARLGAYDVLVGSLEKSKEKKATKLERAGLSFISGAFGALIGNPFDVALIRRQASIANGKNAYKNTFEAFKRIIKLEGITSLWSGLNITILRVALINFGQLAGRDYIS